jgi:hypothetical protein
MFAFVGRCLVTVACSFSLVITRIHCTRLVSYFRNLTSFPLVGVSRESSIHLVFPAVFLAWGFPFPHQKIFCGLYIDRRCSDFVDPAVLYVAKNSKTNSKSKL